MILSFYGDETGMHAAGAQASKFTMIAGYVAPVANWVSFESAWAQLLQSYLVTKVHAIELHQSKESFRNWKSIHKQRFLMDAVGLMGQHNLLGVSCHFNNADYDRVYKDGKKPLKTRIYSRYGLAVAGIAAGVLSIVDNSSVPLDTLNMVLAQGAPGQGDAVHSFNWLKTDDEPIAKKLGSLTFASAGDIPGLQAADLFAYAAHHHISRRKLIAQFPTMWEQYVSVRKPQHLYVFMNNKVLRDMKGEALRLDEVRMQFGKAKVFGE